MRDTLDFDGDADERLKDYFFDPECTASTRQGKEGVAVLIRLFVEAEKKHVLRQRQRKAYDSETLSLQLEAILGNLVTAKLREKPRPVAVPLSKDVLGRKSTHRVYGDTLREVIDVLAKEGWLTLILGSYTDQRLTTIEATDRLLELCKIKRKDFEHQERAPIVLRAKKTAAERAKQRPGKEVKVPDTDDVRRMTREVVRLNRFLAAQDIQYIGRQDVDDQRRTMFRVFNNSSMIDGGRLYGGFWQALSGDKDGAPDDRLNIRINGESVVGLDYGQIAIRILYSLEGKQPAMDDCYVLEPWGVESRQGIKKLMNAMINDPSEMALAVKKLFRFEGNKKVAQLTVEAKETILSRHAPIASHFNGKSTFKLLFEESNHLMALLMELMDKGIPALPIHDCLYVRASDADTVRELMRIRFIERFNVSINVS